jgi:uncharacterized protein YeaO (DUF488 family)
MIKLKRTYEPATPDDGVRVLVERLWPREVKKTSAHLDEWAKEVAPGIPADEHLRGVDQAAGQPADVDRSAGRQCSHQTEVVLVRMGAHQAKAVACLG